LRRLQLNQLRPRLTFGRVLGGGLSTVRERHALGAAGARKRPPTLIYSVDEVPSWPLRLTLAFQHVLAMSVGWVYVVVAVNVIGGTPGQAQSLIRMSLIASGITTILQMGRGVVGSGYLCPASCSLTYLAPSILDARTGGPSLLFGMTTLAGTFTAVLSQFIRRVPWMFPPDVTGLSTDWRGVGLRVNELAHQYRKPPSNAFTPAGRGYSACECDTPR